MFFFLLNIFVLLVLGQKFGIKV